MCGGHGRCSLQYLKQKKKKKEEDYGGDYDVMFSLHINKQSVWEENILNEMIINTWKKHTSREYKVIQGKTKDKHMIPINLLAYSLYCISIH